LQQNNRSNSNRKRESDSKLTFENKRTRRNNKELAKPSIVSDLSSNLIDSKNEKTNGNHKDSRDFDVNIPCFLLFGIIIILLYYLKNF